MTNSTTDALTKQLAEIDRLQRELSEQLREQQEREATGPAAPWLARRSHTRETTSRNVPPWLTRRGRRD